MIVDNCSENFFMKSNALIAGFFSLTIILSSCGKVPGGQYYSYQPQAEAKQFIPDSNYLPEVITSTVNMADYEKLTNHEKEVVNKAFNTETVVGSSAFTLKLIKARNRNMVRRMCVSINTLRFRLYEQRCFARGLVAFLKICGYCASLEGASTAYMLE